MGSLVHYVNEPGRVTAIWHSSIIDRRPEVWLTFDQFRLDKGKLQAEIMVESYLGLRPIRTVLALQSESARTELRRACEDLIPGGKGYWKVRIDSACWHVIDGYRAGEAPISLTGQPSAHHRKWFVDRWIPWGVPTILYGDGGSGKSLMALALAAHALRGMPFGGDPNWRLTPIQGVLIADWEDSAEEFNDRLGGLCAGLGHPVPANVVYKRMQGPLRDGAADLRSLILKHDLDLVIIDSGSVAAGGELESSETALAFADILRALSATTLVTAHVPWSQTEVDGRRRPFGSIFFRNAFRSLIELRASSDDTTPGLQVTCRLEKANHTPRPLPQPAGWQILWQGGGITISPHSAEPAMQGLGHRILQVIPQAPSRISVSEVTERLDAQPDSIQKTLKRLESRNLIAGTAGHFGKGREREYWRVDHSRTDSRTQPDTPRTPPF